MNTEFHTPIEWFMQMLYKTWMEGTYDIPNKNPQLFVTTEPNRMGFSVKFFTEMQIISYIFIILKHIQVSSQF